VLAKVGLIWDLGAGRGHAVRLAELARCLRARGNQVVVFARDLRTLRSTFGALAADLTILAAPHNDWIVADRAAAAWGDILWTECGLHDTEQARALTFAWRDLLALSGVQALLVDAAPLAQLAAALIEIPSVGIGTGFLCPPAGPRWPIFRTWEAVDEASVRERELKIAERIDDIGAGRLGVRDLNGCASALYTFASCDHYPDRQGEAHCYLGPLRGTGNAPRWPHGKRRILVYLQPNYVHLELLRAALLAHSEAAVLAYFGGSSVWADHSRLYQSAGAIDIAQALMNADLVICHGGNLAVLSAAAGVPALLLPTQAEMYLTAQRLCALGVARAITPFDALDFSSPINQLLEVPAWRQRAGRFSTTLTVLDDSQILEQTLALLD